jgi:uncharacterized protein YqeY
LSLKDQIESDFKSVFKAQDKFAIGVLRMIKSEMKYREVEKGAGYLLDDAEVLAVINSGIKKRRDSVELYKQGGRPELADNETKEIEYLSRYLPAMMGEDELRGKVKAVIQSMGSPTVKQMGQVMKAVMAEVAGKADGTLVSKVVKEMLSA